MPVLCDFCVYGLCVVAQVLTGCVLGRSPSTSGQISGCVAPSNLPKGCLVLPGDMYFVAVSACYRHKSDKAVGSWQLRHQGHVLTMPPRKQKTLSVEFSENWIQSHMRAAVQMGKPLILEVAPACDSDLSNGPCTLVQHAPAYGVLLQNSGAKDGQTHIIMYWQ